MQPYQVKVYSSAGYWRVMVYHKGTWREAYKGTSRRRAKIIAVDGRARRASAMGMTGTRAQRAAARIKYPTEISAR